MALLCNDAAKQGNATCQKCPWFPGSFLPSIYSVGSRLAVIQESPSAEDYLDGEVFSGTRGEMVDDWLSDSPIGSFPVASFRLSGIHQFSAVKCSLGNAKPGKEVVNSCRDHLVSDIKHAQKKGLRLAVTLGAFTTRSFFPVSLFEAVRGQPRSVEFGNTEVLVFPTLSPAHILSRPGEEALVRKDFKNIIRIASGLPLESFFSESKTKTVVLNNQIKIRQFLREILPKSRVASLDLETTGYDPNLKEVTKSALNYLEGDILTFNFSLESGVGYILPMAGFEAKKVWSDNFREQISKWLKRALENPKILWIYHNGSFDIPFLVHNLNLDLNKHKFVDTLLMSHLLREDSPKDLKSLASIHTSLGGYERVLKS